MLSVRGSRQTGLKSGPCRQAAGTRLTTEAQGSFPHWAARVPMSTDGRELADLATQAAIRLARHAAASLTTKAWCWPVEFPQSDCSIDPEISELPPQGLCACVYKHIQNIQRDRLIHTYIYG